MPKMQRRIGENEKTLASVFQNRNEWFSKCITIFKFPKENKVSSYILSKTVKILLPKTNTMIIKQKSEWLLS